MIIATLTILLGTIYPIIIEVLSNKRISVGGPYFNSTVIPIMIPGFLLMSIAPILSWQTNKIKNTKLYVVSFIILSLIVTINHSAQYLVFRITFRILDNFSINNCNIFVI